MIRRIKGFTLIEILISIALLGIIISMAFSMLPIGRNSMALSVNEYELQSSMRLAAQKTNNYIRFSTAIFTIPKLSFRENNFTQGWSYLGVKEVEITPGVMGSEIVNYKYVSENNWAQEVLVPAKKDLYYELLFKKNKPHYIDKLLTVKISGYINNGGAKVKKISIDTELEALNALQVIDKSTDLNPAVAIAYRTDNRPLGIVGHIALVLDKSGSMSADLEGRNKGKTRIKILREEAKDMIDKFSQETNIDICLVPFATSANNPKPFRNAKNNRDELIGDINSLEALGGTNTGDGLRRAYHSLKKHNFEVKNGAAPSNYIIVLVDGVTTFASVKSYTDREFITNDGNVDERYLDYNNPYKYKRDGQIAGNGAELDSKGTEYVNTIGSLIKTGNFAKVYVIGFSAIEDELKSVNDIATACGSPKERVFRADSADSLKNIFTTIQQEIMNDLWYLQGPKL